MKMVNSKTSSDISEDSSSSQTEIENHISVSPYEEGEKVFAYHTSCLYEAKVFFLSRFSFLLRSYLNLIQHFPNINRLIKLNTNINDGVSFFIIS